MVQQDDSLFLIDFNVSRNSSKTKLMTKTGTPEYNAPEIYSNSCYDEKVDIWSAGICLYMMMNKGETPFYHQDIPKMIKNIQNNEIEMKDNNSCYDLILLMLDKNPK